MKSEFTVCEPSHIMKENYACNMKLEKNEVPFI
jgi:hypothetical protein